MSTHHNQEIQKMSVTVIVSLKVADFDDWKAAFDAHASSREEAGINAKAYQNLDDPNNPIAIGTASSKEEFPFLKLIAISQSTRTSKIQSCFFNLAMTEFSTLVIF